MLPHVILTNLIIWPNTCPRHWQISMLSLRLLLLEHPYQPPRTFSQTSQKNSSFSNLVTLFFIVIHQPQQYITILINYYFFIFTFLTPKSTTTHHNRTPRQHNPTKPITKQHNSQTRTTTMLSLLPQPIKPRNCFHKNPKSHANDPSTLI